MPSSQYAKCRKGGWRVALTVLVATAHWPNSAGASTGAAATISAGCSQEDLPALIIEIPPHLSIELAGVLSAPITLRLSPLRRDVRKLTQAFARAQWQAESGETAWLRGTLWIDRLVSGVAAVGRYDFRSPSGDVVRGNFRAVWTKGNASCG